MDLQTPRLILRRWRPADIESLAAMNSDPEVMRYFPRMLSYEQSKAMLENIEAKFDRDGFGLWALELKETNEVIGFTGLHRPQFEAHFTPCVEVGWRIARSHWGKGYAPEAAAEAIRHGFEKATLQEIVSFTAAINTNSMRVMQKLKMKSNPEENFLHPLVADGDPLKVHVLYRLTQSDWRAMIV